MAIFWIVLGIVSGACIAVQAPINAQLSRDIGLPFVAAGISFASGLIILTLLSLVLVKTGGISLNWSAPAPWLYVAGGVLGCIYVSSTVILTPQIGAAAVMGLAVTGQLVAGIVVDRFGFMGLAVREVSLGRIAGALLLVAGAMMVRFL
jgi:transporter family-2 protein